MLLDSRADDQLNVLLLERGLQKTSEGYSRKQVSLKL